MSEEAGPSAPPQNGSRFVQDVLDRIDVEAFDWPAYEGTYKGRALITRLLHVPSLVLSSPLTTPSNRSLARAALLRLIPLVRSTLDVVTYTNVMDHLAHLSGKELAQGEDEAMDFPVPAEGSGREAEGVASSAWVQEAWESERRESARLDVELRGYMSNLIKESIRLTYLAFAQLSLKAGKSTEALRNYNAAREYSSSPAHHVDVGVGIVETSLAYNQPMSLPGHISKLEASLDRAYPAPVAGVRATDSASTTAADIREHREREMRAANVRRIVGVKLRVAKGLVALAGKDFEKAGRELGEVGEEGGLGDWEGQAISTADIATITALCTLATGSRDRIRRVLLDRASFRSALDDSNHWILHLVRSFVDAGYGDVISSLNGNEPHVLLNPFLSPHTRILIQQITTRAIIQYVTPFSTVQMGVMASAFDMPEEKMLGEVERLVEEGKIKARIDLIDYVIEMTTPDPRKELFANALKVGKSTSDTTRAALTRMRLHEAGIIVDPRPEQSQGGRVGPTDSLELPELNGGSLDMDETIAA